MSIYATKAAALRAAWDRLKTHSDSMRHLVCSDAVVRAASAAFGEEEDVVWNAMLEADGAGASNAERVAGLREALAIIDGDRRRWVMMGPGLGMAAACREIEKRIAELEAEVR